MDLNSVNSYRNKLRELKKRVGSITPQTSTKKPTEIKSVGLCKTQAGLVEITLPIKTVSEGNCFEPWRKKHNRHKSQKELVKLALLTQKNKIPLPCNIKLIRLAPKILDAHDNLRMALKYILDQVCAEITQDFIPGHADNTPGFSFEYDQQTSKEYSVKILITFNIK